MTTKTQQLIAHAANLLDLKDDRIAAEKTLRTAIESARASGNVVDDAQATTFLGELLATSGKGEEAIQFFEHVLQLGQTTSVEPDQIEPELRIAREHLARSLGLE